MNKRAATETTRHPYSNTDLPEPSDTNEIPNYTFQFKVAQQPRQARATGWSSKGKLEKKKYFFLFIFHYLFIFVCFFFKQKIH